MKIVPVLDRRSLALGLASLAVVLAGVACGGSSDAVDATPLVVTSTPGTSPSAVSNPSGDVVALELTAEGMVFDKGTLTAPAGSRVSLTFVNREAVPHNVAFYTDESGADEIFVGEIVTNETITYEFDAPDEPGTYFFRCDVHPTTMTGAFLVE